MAQRDPGAVAPQPEALDVELNPLVASVSPALTLEAAEVARRLKEAGVDVIALASGEPDFDTPEAIREAGIEAIQSGITHYTPNAGTDALRAAIAAKLRDENGLAWAAAENVVVSNGAKQALWQAVLATCGVGDEVIVPAPYWTTYPEMVRLAGATPVIVRSGSAETGHRLEPRALAEALTPASRLLILCSPCNPTGAVYSRAELEALAEVVRAHPRLLVLADEIYEHINYADEPPVSFASLPGVAGRTLTVNGFSKAFAMTGWRLGYLAAPKPYAAAANKVQSQLSSGASSIAQHAGIAALALGHRGGETVAAMVRAFRRRRDATAARLRALPGIRLRVPEGAFYLFPDVSGLVGPGARAQGFGDVPDTDALTRYLLEKANVAVVTGAAFGVPECIRISYATSDELLSEALSRIEAALDAERYARPGAV